jgi:hypothetical protein
VQKANKSPASKASEQIEHFLNSSNKPIKSITCITQETAKENRQKAHGRLTQLCITVTLKLTKQRKCLAVKTNNQRIAECKTPRKGGAFLVA